MSKEAPVNQRDFFNSAVDSIVGRPIQESETRTATSILPHLEVGFFIDPDLIFPKQILLMQEKLPSSSVKKERRTVFVRLFAKRFVITHYETTNSITEELQRLKDENTNPNTPSLFGEATTEQEQESGLEGLVARVGEMKIAREITENQADPEEDIIDIIAGLSYLTGPEVDEEQADEIMTAVFEKQFI